MRRHEKLNQVRLFGDRHLIETGRAPTVAATKEHVGGKTSTIREGLTLYRDELRQTLSMLEAHPELEEGHVIPKFPRLQEVRDLVMRCLWAQEYAAHHLWQLVGGAMARRNNGMDYTALGWPIWRTLHQRFAAAHRLRELDAEGIPQALDAAIYDVAADTLEQHRQIVYRLPELEKAEPPEVAALRREIADWIRERWESTTGSVHARGRRVLDELNRCVLSLGEEGKVLFTYEPQSGWHSHRSGASWFYVAPTGEDVPDWEPPSLARRTGRTPAQGRTDGITPYVQNPKSPIPPIILECLTRPHEHPERAVGDWDETLTLEQAAALSGIRSSGGRAGQVKALRERIRRATRRGEWQPFRIAPKEVGAGEDYETTWWDFEKWMQTWAGKRAPRSRESQPPEANAD